jgi:tyrosinase
MKLSSMLMAAGAIGQAAALPANQARQGCTNPAKRIEWRQLSAADQQSYIKAVLCLKTKPSRMGLSTPLYDDFPHLHFKLNDYSQYIHAREGGFATNNDADVV